MKLKGFVGVLLCASLLACNDSEPTQSQHATTPSASTVAPPSSTAVVTTQDVADSSATNTQSGSAGVLVCKALDSSGYEWQYQFSIAADKSVGTVMGTTVGGEPWQGDIQVTAEGSRLAVVYQDAASGSQGWLDTASLTFAFGGAEGSCLRQ